MGREVINLSSRDIQQNDTSPYNKFADVTVTANVPVRVGEYQLPANIQRATWGGGRLYIVLYDDTTTAAREEGTFLFKVVGPSGKEDTVARVNSRQAGADGQGSVPSEWYPMPEGGKYTVGGGKLAIDFISDASDTLDTTDNYIYSLPAVIYTA
jgi:hypothetical protein